MAKEFLEEKEDNATEEVKEEDEDIKPSIIVGSKKKDKKKEVEKEEIAEPKDQIFALRTTANREDQVMDFVISNAQKKKMAVYTIIRPHGMRGYIFIEAASRQDAEQVAFNVPYARGILPNIIKYEEIEHMLEQVKVQVNIQKRDIVEIISGPFKREQARVARIDRTKDEVVVELLEAAVPIPITVKMDSVKVIRRDTEDESGGATQSKKVEDDEPDELDEFMNND